MENGNHVKGFSRPVEIYHKFMFEPIMWYIHPIWLGYLFVHTKLYAGSNGRCKA